MQFLKDAAVAA
jgi:hypothetical protein